MTEQQVPHRLIRTYTQSFFDGYYGFTGYAASNLFVCPVEHFYQLVLIDIWILSHADCRSPVRDLFIGAGKCNKDKNDAEN